MRSGLLALAAAMAGLLGACGGGGGGSSSIGIGIGNGNGNGATVAPVAVVDKTSIELVSEFGDYVGQGKSYVYTQANAVLSVTAAGNRLSVRINGDETWDADFQLPASQAQPQPGSYTGLQRYPFNDAARGGLNWSGEGRGCNTLLGNVTIDAVVFAGGALSSLDLRFEQHCEGAAAALRGVVHWRASDTTAPPGPVVPVPSTLWAPEHAHLPVAGNYVYLESQAGDFAGGGKSYLYTQSNATLTLDSSGTGRATFGVVGDESWNGDFLAMNSLGQLQPGYYPDLHRFPFHNPTKGGMQWSGQGGCNTLTGWFAVDSVTYVAARITAIDLRFEQHCEGAAAALHGRIHWAPGDASAPPGPVDPAPAGLWAPMAGAVPATGAFVYLESQAGDFIGQGQNHLYTASNAVLAVSGNGGHLGVSVDGPGGWSGDFQAMNTLPLLRPGYYGDLRRFPFHNPSKGGLDWSGHGAGCNRLQGWFVIDSITYAGTDVASVALRFEQHCEGLAPALHGQIRWPG